MIRSPDRPEREGRLAGLREVLGGSRL